ncbi:MULTISPECIES: hypothetical protein [unclassified Moorena]|uniref:hypothetical protein n=1 Tax=unclassified Moorena TaxID=2683338 RepID=UPI0002E94546|nr:MULTISPECIES: hypothetical protein [unclassified Moorena]NEQ09208.1 hypothetical protein [Moorena sp. SIO4E2]NEQ13355.1 hypothetical protein [Moorena sp. SIO3E2]NES44184.1 hypothetical protein [Moorena sp. SIO2C4]
MGNLPLLNSDFCLKQIPSEVSKGKLSAISYQLSAFNYQHSVISIQLSVISYQRSVISG